MKSFNFTKMLEIHFKKVTKTKKKNLKINFSNFLIALIDFWVVKTYWKNLFLFRMVTREIYQS